MATADQYETAIDTIRTALGTLLGYGNSGSAPGAIVTATSTRKHVAVKSADFRQLWRDLDRGTPTMMRHDRAGGGTPNGGPNTQILMAEAANGERVLIMRVRP